MTPSEVHEWLDTQGLLDDSHDPGTYGLEVDTPDSVEAVARRFHEHVDTTPSSDTLQRIANADDVAYVGASGNVYDRLQDHADAEVRQALFLRVFDLVGVLGVWPAESPFEAEYGRALSLGDEYVVWCDGELI